MFSKRAFFGRRQGKALRSHQRILLDVLLPGLLADPAQETPADIRALFALPVKAVCLEIGFGCGEHLLHEAALFPDIGFIGVEPYVNGMAKILGILEREPLMQQHMRLYNGDAIHLLDWLPEQSLDGINLFYPDPWPKRKHWKRRFVNQHNLDRFARVMKRGALFRFVSDIDSYINWTLLHILRHSSFSWTAQDADDWRIPCDVWPGTRYEEKAICAGRKPAYLTFVRI